MTSPSSNNNVTDEDETTEIIVHKNLSENQSKDVRKSERNIVNKILSLNKTHGRHIKYYYVIERRKA